MKATNLMRPLIFAAILMPAAAMAQGGEDSQTMQLDIYGDLKLFLRDANKISAFPETKDGKVDMTTMQYGIIPGKRNFEAETKPIDPAKIHVEPRLGKLYRGYLRGGYGLYNTPLAEVYYTDGRSRKGTFGVHGKHLSTGGGVTADDSIPDSFSRNSVDLWGKIFLNKSAIDLSTNWNREVFNAYGFSPDSFPATDLGNLRNRFNTFALNGAWKTFHRDSTKINMGADVRYRYFADAFNGNENNVNVHLHGRKFENKELYILDFGVNYNKFAFVNLADGKNTDTDNALISILPRAAGHYMNFDFEMGMGIWVDSRGDQNFHFYPMVEGSYRLLQDIIVPYAGMTGRKELNTYHDIIGQNPFVLTDIELKNTNQKLKAYIGLRGNLTSAVSFNLNASYSDYEDYLLFVNDTAFSNTNRFRALYENLSITEFSGEVSYLGLDKLKFHIKGSYFLYDVANEPHAWHQPNYRATLSTAYNMQDKFLFNLDVYLIGQRFARSDGFVPGSELALFDGGWGYQSTLRGLADVNLGAEYRYTKRLTAFVKFNNMLASRYQMWNNYNLQRFNAMLGASYSF
jgi:hypothetical protein